MPQFGTNCDVEISKDGKTATIKIDLTKTFGQSGTGKSITIASTGGNQSIGLPSGETVSLGLNCYKKNKDYKPS